VGNVIAHVRRRWPGWGALWPAPFLAWAVFQAAMGTFRWEHAALATIVAVLAYAGSPTKRLFLGLLPFGLLALVYDAMRYVKDVGITPERVHACDLRAFDARLFGVGVGADASRMALPEWLQTHSVPALDRLCAVPYGTFIYVSLGVAIWLYVREPPRLGLFGWTFLAVNVAGFITYHVFPAAPPWYVQAHGCAVDLSAHASEGPNLARVDAWLGTGYFHGFYGRSSVNVLFGWKLWRAPGRALALAYFGLMGFAAVYLDHHWVIDVVMGMAYTIVAWAIAVRIRARTGEARQVQALEVA
jgi:hypothetical protein